MLEKIRRLFGLPRPEEPNQVFQAIEQQTSDLRERLKRLEDVTERQALKRREHDNG